MNTKRLKSRDKLSKYLYRLFQAYCEVLNADLDVIFVV